MLRSLVLAALLASCAHVEPVAAPACSAGPVPVWRPFHVTQNTDRSITVSGADLEALDADLEGLRTWAAVAAPCIR